MNNDFLLCVRCDTFNQSNFIKYALDGFVMQQTTFPFVAVVIDDASTDGEQRVIQDYLDEHFDNTQESGFRQWETEDACWVFARHKENTNCYFVVVYLKKNLYLNPKKVELIKEWRTTKYYAYCEGDDYWRDPLKLQKQVAFLDSHVEYSMCCTAFSQTFDGDETNKSDVIFKLDDITIDDILRGQWIGTLTVVFRNELMADFRFPFDGLVCEDLSWWCYLALKGKIRYLKDVTANYRCLKNSECHPADLKKQILFNLDTMRLREYYAIKANKLSVAQPKFAKDSHYYLEQCYKNKWFDFPMDILWHFVKEYGHPSGYDNLKHWGMKSKLRYSISKKVLSTLKKK
jgi:glycosyltransferase involved in cell wall biosynthesis